jgi:signal peptidase
MIVKATVQLGKVLVIALTVFVCAIIITSKFENPWGIRSFVVLSGSMQPSIQKGSIIFSQKNTNYQKGDVISFRKDDMTVTHRIIDIQHIKNQTVFITKGDANNAKDSGSVQSQNILGRNIGTLPFVGNVLIFMRSLGGFILLVIAPAFLYITFEIYSIKSEP